MSERQVEWAGVRMPHACSISRLARNSWSASSWRPVAARTRARVWRVPTAARPDIGSCSRPRSCHRRSAPSTSSWIRRISTCASAPGRTMKLGCAAAFSASASASARLPRRHHAPARRCEPCTNERNEPCSRAQSSRRVNSRGGLDERAAEQQRQRRDVDGGDARAGVVEQVERAQGELARLGRAAASSPRGRRGRRRTAARRACAGRRRARRSGSPTARASAGRGAVALRGGAARGLQQQAELLLLVGEGVDRARQRRDRLHRAVGQLQRGAELGRDGRVVGGGDREVLGGRVVLRGLQLDRAELTAARRARPRAPAARAAPAAGGSARPPWRRAGARWPPPRAGPARPPGRRRDRPRGGGWRRARRRRRPPSSSCAARAWPRARSPAESSA